MGIINPIHIWEQIKLIITKPIIYVKAMIKTICIYKEKYPESSMSELAEIISSETEKPISKSCINHRFRKIKEMINL